MAYLYFLPARLLRVLVVTVLIEVLFVSTSPAQPDLEFNEVLTGLNGAVDIVNAGDGSDRLFIVQRTGAVHIYSEGILLPNPFINLAPVITSSGSEQGLLSIAFHPDYNNNSNRYFYVYYTRTGDGAVTIARYETSETDSNVANGAMTGQVMLTVPKPSGRTNHNGGKLNFGPGGYLYFALGDGGGTGDPDNFAQNGNNLRGKMLRIDVNNPVSPFYSIPAGNPYDDNSDGILDEIWAMGLRNPWRWSFDRLNNDMWIADVGQGVTEEINFRANGTTGGINYGWRCYEGTNDYSTAGCQPLNSYVSPVFQYPHNNVTGGFSVTGGYVYRGANYPTLYGYYIMADYVSGNLWKIIPASGGGWDISLQDDLPGNISGFGEDEDGELYAVSLNGSVYRVQVENVLPVTITDFSGIPQNGSVALTWKTEQEVNVKQYEVEYSTDAITFQQAAVVPSGNYLQEHTYRYNHVVFNANKVYYRLKSVDIDGHFEYSTVISVVITGMAKNYIYPTIITNGRVSIYLSEPYQSIDIVSIDGKIVRKENLSGRTGRIDISLPAMASGTWLVKLIHRDPQKNIVEKVIIR